MQPHITNPVWVPLKGYLGSGEQAGLNSIFSSLDRIFYVSLLDRTRMMFFHYERQKFTSNYSEVKCTDARNRKD